MTIYSNSKLRTFEHCQLKFKFRYIDNIKPDFEETIESFLGKQVHKVLEWIYNNPRNLDLDDIIKYFIESWNQEFSQEIRIIKRDISAEHYFNKGIKFLINYFFKNSPFIDNTIATEKRVFVNLDSEGKYKMIGFIDRLVHNSGNIFEIHDYKTSADIKTQEELDNDRQLALYSMAIRDDFENVSDVLFIWHFLEHNQVMSSKRTLEQLENLKIEIIALINKIESTTYFQANPGPLCNWCEFQSKCPVFKEYKEKLLQIK